MFASVLQQKSQLLVRVVAVFYLLTALNTNSAAQSITLGDITGAVTDQTGAPIVGASVTAVNTGTNTSQRTTTNGTGSFRLAFLSPGSYNVAISAEGFQTHERHGLIVNAGQPTAVTVQLELATQIERVVVVGDSLPTDNADPVTSISNKMLQDLPNPGGDITYPVLTVPGVVMNSQGGYGNFAAVGMPATSNLFSINGQNSNDPFFGVNNSGASNLLLGANDIGEANVINNAYSAQYGQYAGSQITYITKSGTKEFHANAVYNWNGRALNSNQFFSNQVGQPTPFNNFNQWAAGAQGPIWRDHTFFDVDYEGLRNVLPTASALTLIPSQQFQRATLQNLTTNGKAGEIPFYNQIFKIYNNAPGAASAVPVAQNGGCQDFTGLPAGVPCALQFRTTPPNSNKEYQWAARVDHYFTDKDHGYVRFLRDNGYQPTFTSPFGSVFNAQSNQPQMSVQVSEVHTFGPNTVNQVSGSGLFYAAVFEPSDASGALAALPTFVGFSGGPLSALGALTQPGPFFYPQGRRVFQYQLMDDFSQVKGRHTFRAGFGWLHDNITDLDFEGNIHGLVIATLADFFNGGGPSTTLSQNFPSSPEEGLRFNTYGGYVADDWKVTDRLTVSLNLRLESYANPTCATNCFARLAKEFSGAPVANATSIPYNQFIISGQHNAYPNTQPVVWEPRLGIAWRPTHSDKTVIRTGAGVFADEFSGALAENAAFNSPGFNSFTIGNGAIAPGVAGSLFTTAALANQALISQFKSGGSYNSISQSVPGFAPPNFDSFPNTFHQPTYYKWNVELQRVLPWGINLSLNYSGMHGSHIPVADEGLNAYCPPSVCPNGFVGLPAAAPNAALGIVTQYLSAGTASYNGLILSLQKRFETGLTFNFNYTWSHALDDVSNGGNASLPFGALDTDPSITVIQDPHNVRGNYGNADYDIRHYLSAAFVLSDFFRNVGFHRGPHRIFGGWTLSGNWFFRTGLPFTVVDNADFAPLAGLNYSGAIFASPITRIAGNCGNAVNSPCLNTSQFAPSGALTGFGTLGRNSLRGPHFFDVDLAVMKEIRIAERARFSFGAQAYNLLNHPNFDQPVNDISNPLFGSTIAVVGPPTSLLGSFVGSGSSPRFLEIKGILRF